MRYKNNVLKKLEGITNTISVLKYQINRSERKELIMETIEKYENIVEEIEDLVSKEQETLH